MASAKPVTDHGRIRRWAEARRARPACVIDTGNSKDPGIIRLDFPGVRADERLQAITWERWFKAFEANNLALLIDEDDRNSKFNKLVSRETVDVR